MLATVANVWWPCLHRDAKLLRQQKTEKVLEVLQKCISCHGIPKMVRTDPATIFHSKLSEV